jgi:hypothetical protein
MLSAPDFKRLEHGSSRVMRQGVFVALIVGALCLVGVGVGDIWLATRLAEIVHTKVWDVFWFELDFRQSYSGAAVGAADLLWRGVRLISYGIGLFTLAFLVRAQARFYARLRAELQARDA